MIRKTRLSFVAVTMTLLAAVVVFFVGTTIFINYRTSRSETGFALQRLLHKTVDVKGDMKPQPDEMQEVRQRFSTFACKVSDSGVYVNSDTLYGNLFDDESEAETFVGQIVVNGVLKNATQHDDGSYSGRCGNLYFMMDTTDSGAVRTVVIDRTLEEQMLTNTTLTLAILSAVALVAIFVIVWVLSYRVVKPVADAFDKQRRFVSDASHELKTPVTIIRANAEALQSEQSNSEWANNILSQTDRLTHLVEEMLTLARLEEKQSVKRHVDVSATVETASLEFETLAYEQGKRFTVNVDENVQLYVDPDDVRRVVTLLSDNAVKYGDTFVDIKFVRAQHGGRLTVTNDGCQVPSEHKDKLFERFYREDTSRTRDTGGSGLGLSTVKALCDRNKWRISIDCEQGGNMSVTVEMG